MSKKKKKIIIITFIVILVVLLVVVFVVGFSPFKSGFKYIPLESVVKKQYKVVKKDYDNLILPKEIREVNPEKLYTFDSIRADKPITDESKKLFVELVNVFSNRNYTTADLSYLDIEPSYAELFDNGYLNLFYEGNTFDLTTKEFANKRINNIVKIEKVIHVDRGEKTNVSYDVDGKSYSVKQAIAYAEEYLEKINISKYLLKGDELRISSVSVVEVYDTDEDAKSLSYEERQKLSTTYIYLVNFDHYYYGVPVNNSGTNGYDDNGFHFPRWFTVGIGAPDSVGWLYNVGSWGLENQQEITDDVIDLSSCLSTVSEWLSEYKKYEVKEISMVYNSIQYGINNGDSFEIRPMWRIVLDEYDGSDKSFNMASPKLTVNVDMQNGNMYMFDDASGEMVDVRLNNKTTD